MEKNYCFWMPENGKLVLSWKRYIWISKNGIFEYTQNGLVYIDKNGNSRKKVGPDFATAFQKRKGCSGPQPQVADTSQIGSWPLLSKKSHQGRQPWHGT